MVYITGIHLGSDGTGVEHIEQVQWLNSSDGKSNRMTTARMVAWLQTPGNAAQVGGPDGPVNVEVVDAKPPYIRTRRDNTAADNLLSLPQF